MSTPKNQFDRIYVNFSYPINAKVVGKTIAECSALYQNHTPKELYFLISSPGGSVRDGITLYNHLNALPCEIIMHNIGSIDSIAICIFMAGDKRYACSGTSFHFHGVGIQPNGHHNLAKLKELVSSLEGDEKKISHIVSKNTSLSEEAIGEFFSQGESKDTDFALNNDIISKIKDANLDPNYPIHSLTL